MKTIALLGVCLCVVCVEAAAQTATVQTVAEGADWVPVEYLRDIVPGSALDFSVQGIHDAPAGKHGWLVSRNGHAEFENLPGVPARFYGVSLCNTANYLSDDEIEQVTDRLVRLGYNAVRFHHHDDDWAKDSSSSRARLDALMAACLRKGIYLTTDIFVSRKCAWRDLGVDSDGNADSQTAKLRMMTTEAGFTNWCDFARAFLTRVNPHTGRCLAQEPGMPMLVLINESSPHSGWDKAKAIPEFRALWPVWLAEARAADPAAFPTASAGTFPETGGWWDPSQENSAKAAFWAWVCGRFARRATAFLRDELGVQALISTENHGPSLPSILQMRAAEGGYVDSHYYTEQADSASLAVRDETGLPLVGVFRNHNPLVSTRGMYPDIAFHRVWGRPFVVSESQMTGPNFNRAMSGLLTGAFASVQDWTGVWTFALAHHREKLFDGVDAEPGRFDLSLDPLMQATDRLPTLLFLRGDQVTPQAALANYFSAATMRSDAEGSVSLSSRPAWAGEGLEWRSRLGVAFAGESPPAGVTSVPATQTLQTGTANECGVSIDSGNGEIVVSGARTCGAFVQAGRSFNAGALSASASGHSALVAATALGGDSIGNASRILVWHLTDLHGEGFSWGGQITSLFHKHTGILDWGTSRCMLHAGEAEIQLRVNRPLHVFALDTAGNRRAEIPATYNASTGVLRFTASSRQSFGGCLYYEAASDLSVAQGESLTISANASYDDIVVNGSLAIADGVSVTAASLVVATNITGDATVTLAPGASLTLMGDVHLGYDGGQAHLDVKSGANLSVGGDLCMAYGHAAAPAANAEPTRAFLTVSTNATVRIDGDNGLNFEQGTFWPSGTTQKSTSIDTVRLESGAVVTCRSIRKFGYDGARSSTIVFAGGRIEAGVWNGYVFAHNSKNATLYLESENGNPIRVKDTSKINRWFNFSTASAWIKVSGDGDLVLENTTQYPDVNWKSGSWDESKPNVSFLTGGRVRLVGGNLVSYPVNAFAAVTNASWTHVPRALVLDGGATIDMKGVDAEFSSIDGAVLNSTGAACTLTLGGDGSDSAYSASLPSGVSLRKTGAGNLSFSSETAGNISVQGGSLSFSANAGCGAIVVNGGLAIAEGVSVTAASLVVATNITGDATVTLAPGASLTLSGDVHLGYDGGQAHLNVLSGANLAVGSDLCMAYGHTGAPAANAAPTRAFLTVSNATVTISGANGLNFEQGTFWPSGTTQKSTSVDTVRLETGAVVECNLVRKFAYDGARSSTIVFAGGRIRGGTWNGAVFSHNSKNATLYLESENGCPVYVENKTRINRWFNFGTASAWIMVSGDGDFVLENTVSSTGVNWNNGSWDEAKPNVSFLTGGRVRLVGGNLISYPVNAFGNVANASWTHFPRTLVLESGATIDMKGVDAEFAAFNDMDGAILNSTGAACSLTVGGDDADAIHPYPLALPAGVTLRKGGTGTLSLLAADAAAVAVQGGSLSLLGRSEVGYPFYKFNIRGTVNTGTTNHRVQVSEFKFLDGTNDVTQGWDAYHYENRDTSYYNQPTAMWDGNFATDFYDQRDQDWGSISNCAPVLEYRPPRKVTGYTWATGNDWNRRRDNYPVSWAVFGSADNATWTQLDAVDGFSMSNPGLGQWCGTNFVCTYAPTTATLDSLTLASGATLAVDGADVTVSSATAAAGGVQLALAHGAALALPAATEVASLLVDVDAGGGTLANFRPAQGGALYLTGDIAKPRSCVLPVSVGSLLGGNISSWRVYVDGVLMEKATVAVNADGFLEIRSNTATVVFMQ